MDDTWMEGGSLIINTDIYITQFYCEVLASNPIEMIQIYKGELVSSLTGSIGEGGIRCGESTRYDPSTRRLAGTRAWGWHLASRSV